jgi:hypothetical protein
MDVQDRLVEQGEATKATETIAAGIGILAVEGALLKFGVDIDSSVKLVVANTLGWGGGAFVIAGGVRLANHFKRSRDEHHE